MADPTIIHQPRKDEKFFYFSGLEVLMQGVRFTPAEMMFLERLREEAAKGDEMFQRACAIINRDLRASIELERLKNTLRRLDKGSALQAYYDRAA